MSNIDQTLADSIACARMQSLLVDYVVLVPNTTYGAFAGIVMPFSDLCVFLIYVITKQRPGKLNWYQKKRDILVRELNPCMNEPEKFAGETVVSVYKKFQTVIANLSDAQLLVICEQLWPEDVEPPLSPPVY